MCRMAILHFSERGAITAHYMFDALIVSSNDGPYLKAIARDGRHCHGYGFVAALNDGRGWRVVYERFDAEPSLTGEEACQSNLEALENGVERLKNLTAKVEEALIMLHSRRMMNEPRGIMELILSKKKLC